MKIYDVIIIGGGPAGYTAALYSTRAGFKTLIIEKLSAGGQMALTDKIDNYPGFDGGVDGFLLGEKMKKGAEKFGAETKLGEVKQVRLSGEIKEIKTESEIFLGKVVMIASGASPKKLGLEKEDELVGKGISYCATCDGMFYRGKTVAVVGGGNSATGDALILSRICKEVILIHRKDTLNATKIYHDPLMQTKNVTFYWDSVVEKLLSNEKLSGVHIKNLKTGKELDIDCDGLFIGIGRRPVTEFLQGQLPLDSYGYIIADESTRTNIPGVFAIGDVRTKALRQIVTAVADGAVAVHFTEKYLVDKN